MGHFDDRRSPGEPRPAAARPAVTPSGPLAGTGHPGATGDQLHLPL